MSEDLDERLLAHVGREQTFTAPEPLGEAAVRYFALATADANPLYGGTERAGLSRHRGMIAPPTLICETNQILGGEPGRGSDGVALRRRRGLDGVALRRRRGWRRGRDPLLRFEHA